MNLSPAGWNLTAFTPSPVGAVIVIEVFALRAPGGITSVCGPALMVPPSGPIVFVFDAYGRLEHLSSPVAPSNEPMRSAWGAGAAATGIAGADGGSPQDCETKRTRTRTASARTAFMGLLLRVVSGSDSGEPAEVQDGTIPGSFP